MFESIEEVREKLAEQEYVCDRRLATVVYLAAVGQAGPHRRPGRRGQDRASEVARGSRGPVLIRLQCYEGLDEAKALYEWEYGKQLLYTQVLREKIGEVLGPTEGLREAAELREQEDVFFSENFLVERPILQAITSETRPYCCWTRSTGPTKSSRRSCWSSSAITRSPYPRSGRRGRASPGGPDLTAPANSPKRSSVVACTCNSTTRGPRWSWR